MKPRLASWKPDSLSMAPGRLARFAGLRVSLQPGSSGLEMVAQATISWLGMASVLAEGENPHVALNAGERWPPKNLRVRGVRPVAAENVRTGCVARERRAPEEARFDVLRRVRVALLDSASAFRALATIARAVDLEGLLEGFLDGAVGGAVGGACTTSRPSHSPCRYLRHW